MSDHEAERRAFWDACLCAIVASGEQVTAHALRWADEFLAERDKRFPPSAKEAAPEQDALIPCPVCGKQPEWEVKGGKGVIGCLHRGMPCQFEMQKCATTKLRPFPEARAAWNSMGRQV